MFPLYDENPTARRPYVTFLLIAACIAVFIWQLSLEEGFHAATYALGFTPGYFFATAETIPELHTVPPILTPLTSMFLHGSWLHLISNVWFLWIFGNNVEDALGHGRFLLFYVLCGIAAAFAQAAAGLDSVVPMIGASGAIAGVLGAYILLHPRARVVTFIFLGVIITTLRIPAVFFLGLWFAIQVLNGLAVDASATEGGVAWWAHIGGFLAGALLIPFMRQPGYPLFAAPAAAPRNRGPWR